MIHVARRALDSVLEEVGQETVDMIKIDVEGAELEVLRGAIRTLSSNKGIRLLLDIHSKLGVDPREVCLFLGELGFSMCRMRAPFDTPVQMDSSHVLGFRPLFTVEHGVREIAQALGNGLIPDPTAEIYHNSRYLAKHGFSPSADRPAALPARTGAA